MISGNEWFIEYLMLPDDEKEAHKEFILDSEKKAIVLDYERFKCSIELVATKPDDLQLKYNEKICVAEEVALGFDNECVYIAHQLKSQKYISKEVYNLVMQIDKQLDLLSNEHNKNNWTIQTMNIDRRWIKARELANEACKLLACI